MSETENKVVFAIVAIKFFGSYPEDGFEVVVEELDHDKERAEYTARRLQSIEDKRRGYIIGALDALGASGFDTYELPEDHKIFQNGISRDDFFSGSHTVYEVKPAKMR